MLQQYRKQDAVFIVCQNYDKQMLEMAGANDKAKQLTGLTDENMVGKPLQDYIAGDLLELIEDDLEYDDRNYDLGDLLAKVRTVNLRTADGGLRELRLRVVRSEALEGNPIFHLVMQNEDEERENAQFRKILTENFKGNEKLDENTHLPDRDSLIKDIELIQHHQKTKLFGACFAVMQVDKMELIRKHYDESACYGLLSDLAKLCRQRLREDDLIGIVSERSLGIILMQISPDSARIVLNRLRWTIGSMPIILDDGRRIDVTVSIAFHMCGDANPHGMLEACEADLAVADEKGGSFIHGVG
jgi:GGDEF domain-containing protein